MRAIWPPKPRRCAGSSLDTQKPVHIWYTTLRNKGWLVFELWGFGTSEEGRGVSTNQLHCAHRMRALQMRTFQMLTYHPPNFPT